MKRFIIVTMTLLTTSSAVLSAHKSSETTIKLIATSDVHGAFFAYDFLAKQPAKGSMARVMTFVNNVRNKIGNDAVCLLDNGDILQGQPISYYYNYVQTNRDNIAAEVLNFMKYDAATIGNHDLETGHAVYDKWKNELTCPLLGANVINTRSGRPYFLPYTTIVKRNGVRISIIGMLTPAIPNWLEEELWSGISFEEIVSCAQRTIDEVKKKENPDIIVGLFHSGWNGGIKTETYDEDAAEQVAKQVQGFDVIFFGHDHTMHNSVVKREDGRTVLCLNPANNAMRVALATVRLVKRKGRFEIKEKSGELVDVRKLEPDSVFEEHFKNEINEVKAWSAEEIGRFKETISSKDCYFGSSAFNDLILQLELDITHSDIAFNAPLQFNTEIKAGPITIADMFKLYKYENGLYVMRLTGREIKQYLEMSYALWTNTMRSADDHLLLLANTKNDSQRAGFKNLAFNFDSAAGIDYEVDVTKPNGEKVRIIRMSSGEPFDENKFYNVAINSYRGNGGGELLTKGAGIAHDALKGRIVWKSERDQRYYLIEEIKKAGEMNPKPLGNWKFVPEKWTIPAALRDRKLLFGDNDSTFQKNDSTFIQKR